MVREKDLFPIGRVVKPHGVKGKIKVRIFWRGSRPIFSLSRGLHRGQQR